MHQQLSPGPGTEYFLSTKAAVLHHFQPTSRPRVTAP